mmetsp:Transcript_9193/g.23169  ORF Transcript_9193/g.23169 Transcript_9193/m.23169 type:complete len:89 (+) Transcript_9193:2328-2594(+)
MQVPLKAPETCDQTRREWSDSCPWRGSSVAVMRVRTGVCIFASEVHPALCACQTRLATCSSLVVFGQGVTSFCIGHRDNDVLWCVLPD